MTTILDTIESYEDRLLELVGKAKGPVVEYVAKGVQLVDGRLPEVTYPKSLPTPPEVVASQTRFSKKLIDANAALVTAVLETVAPVAGYAKPKKATKTAKAA
ncbi:MAG TPA: hypothetical protein VFV32_08455 [Acidimicrobiales bacterium]|nr:hypothetical protein [Acidimicrobiales bacterium]